MASAHPALPPIKDQGRRGTCVAFAATAGHEMARSDGEDLSEEFLHWAAKQRDRLPPSAEGTTLPAATQALAEVGQPPEALWAYDARCDARAASYAPTPDAAEAAKARRFDGSVKLEPTAAALREALEGGMSVALGVRLYVTWYRPGDDGRIAMPTAGATPFGGHAVLVVGYAEEDGNGFFTVRNSWGADWADGGYGYLPSAYVNAHGVAAWGMPMAGEDH